MARTSGMPAFVVIAEFLVKAESLPAFLNAAMMDATASLSTEPGCRQFDIIRPESPVDTVIFYEVYDSRAAFDAHLATPHVAAFREAFPPLVVAERPVRFAERYAP
jgi:quinol monooxygenase YgiN